MLAPNTLLKNRYQIVQLIGKGGMGAVYQALDKTFDSTVAIKETFFTDDHLRKAFEREARLLNRLRHAALPVVFDYFFEGEGQFLVMQFIAGNDLGVMLEKRKNTIAPIGKPKPFEIVEVLPWVEQLLDALDYLHTQIPPVIHRDIKPQNLKLTSRGEIILLDFGLAKGAATQMHATASGSLFGYTPNYAPLEQIHGSGTDARSDLYSLAATIYHLLSGETPEGALARATAILSGRADPLAPLQGWNPQVPENIASILARAMSPNPNERPQSAVEMLNAWRAAKQYLQSKKPNREPEKRHEDSRPYFGTPLGIPSDEPAKKGQPDRFTVEFFSDPATNPQAPIDSFPSREEEEKPAPRQPKTKGQKDDKETTPKPPAETKSKDKTTAKKFPDLSPQRQQILELLIEGLSDEQIARWIDAPVSEVSEYITKLRHDVGVITRKDLIIWAMTHVIKAASEKREPPRSAESKKKPEPVKPEVPKGKPPMDYLPAQNKQRILEFLVQGLRDEEIAQRLHIQKDRVSSLIIELEREAGVITRKDLIFWAMSKGIKAPPKPPPVIHHSDPTPIKPPPAKQLQNDDAATPKGDSIGASLSWMILFGFLDLGLIASVYQELKKGNAPQGAGEVFGLSLAMVLGLLFTIGFLKSLANFFAAVRKR